MFEKLKKSYYRCKAKRTLINRYEYLVEVNNLMEEDTTEKILGGGSAEFLAKGREQLIKLQGETREYNRFVAFLKKVK